MEATPSNWTTSTQFIMSKDGCSILYIRGRTMMVSLILPRMSSQTEPGRASIYFFWLMTCVVSLALLANACLKYLPKKLGAWHLYAFSYTVQPVRTKRLQAGSKRSQHQNCDIIYLSRDFAAGGFYESKCACFGCFNNKGIEMND